MKPATGKPCKECPFRRKSPRGYLGASTPREFIVTTMRDTEMPCHMTVDYEDPDWHAKLYQWRTDRKARQCSGAAIFFANIVKASRDPDRTALPPDREAVFVGPDEFLQHHCRGKAPKWSPLWLFGFE